MEILNAMLKITTGKFHSVNIVSMHLYVDFMMIIHVNTNTNMKKTKL